MERGKASNGLTSITAAFLVWTVAESRDLRAEMSDKLARWVRGDREVIVATLEMSGVQLAVVNGASQAAPVKTLTQYETRALP